MGGKKGTDFSVEGRFTRLELQEIAQAESTEESRQKSAGDNWECAAVRQKGGKHFHLDDRGRAERDESEQEEREAANEPRASGVKSEGNQGETNQRAGKKKCTKAGLWIDARWAEAGETKMKSATDHSEKDATEDIENSGQCTFDEQHRERRMRLRHVELLLSTLPARAAQRARAR